MTTIATADCFRYALPLRAPLALGARTLHERRGLLLRLEGADGAVGWGEAAPLPGFSTETLDEATHRLRRRAEELSGVELMESVIDDVLRRQAGDEEPPSVQFAVTSAIAELWADQQETTVSAALGGGAQSVPINALIADDESALSEVAEQYQAAGFQAVKLKVGRHSIEKDIARVQALSEVLGEAISLRLDANRAWTYEQAVAFAERIEDVPVEYIEEPLEQADRLPAFIDATGMPVAIDETTREGGPGMLNDLDEVAAVVLKPMLLGGIRLVRRWSIHALNVGATPVFSAAYESGVGTRMLVALAAVFSEAPAGLSTYSRLETDVLSPRLSMETAEVSVEAGFASTVMSTRLQPIEAVE